MAWKTQFGNLPNDRELKIAADEYIKQEILISEAMELGLDKDDEIIRRRLAQKMEFIIKDNITIPEPDQSELEKYYNENKKKFEEPSKVSFTHIYFSPLSPRIKFIFNLQNSGVRLSGDVKHVLIF